MTDPLAQECERLFRYLFGFAPDTHLAQWYTAYWQGRESVAPSSAFAQFVSDVAVARPSLLAPLDVWTHWCQPRAPLRYKLNVVMALGECDPAASGRCTAEGVAGGAATWWAVMMTVGRACLDFALALPVVGVLWVLWHCHRKTDHDVLLPAEKNSPHRCE